MHIYLCQCIIAYHALVDCSLYIIDACDYSLLGREQMSEGGVSKVMSQVVMGVQIYETKTDGGRISGYCFHFVLVGVEEVMIQYV